MRRWKMVVTAVMLAVGLAACGGSTAKVCNAGCLCDDSCGDEGVPLDGGFDAGVDSK